MVLIEYYQDATSKNAEFGEYDNIADFIRSKEFTKEDIVKLRFFNGDILGDEIDTSDVRFLYQNTGEVCVLNDDTIPKADPVSWTIAAVVIGVVSAGYAYYVGTKALKGVDDGSANKTTSSTNSLSESQNEPRVNERIDDIFGFVKKHTPPLWQLPYRIGVNDREVEVLFCCVGRGRYAIDNQEVYDGTTRIVNIPNSAVDVYEPGTHPGRGGPSLQIGSGVNEPIGIFRQSNDLDASELLPPNDLSLGGRAQWVIKSDGVTIDFTLSNADSLDIDLRDYFSINNNCTLIDCYVLSGNPITKTLYKYDLTEYMFTVFTEQNNISGDYIVNDVTKTTMNIEGAAIPYFVSQSLKQTYYSYLDGVTYYLGDSEITDGEYYTDTDGEGGVTGIITVTTYRRSPDVGQVFDNILGPFTLDQNVDQIQLNLSSSSGFYKVDETTYKSVGITVRVVIEETDDSGNATGNSVTHDIAYGSNPGNNTSSVYRHYRYDVPYEYSRIYARRLSNRDKSENVTSADRCEWTLLYTYQDVNAGNLDLGDVTTAHVLIVNNSQSRLSKKRKFNLDVTRKITQYLGSGQFGSNETYATDDACQIAIHTGLDKWNGRLTLNELDADGLLVLSDEVTSYFNSPDMTRFGFDFDDNNISYADMFGQIMDVINCIPYTSSGVYSAYLERPRDNSSMQITCRNKITPSETRKDIFYTDNDSIELTYRDEVDGVSRTIYVPDSGSGSNPNRISYEGCITELQAWRRAWREYNKLIHKTQEINFDTDEIGRLVIPGMRIDSPDSTRFTRRANAVDGYRIYDGEVVDVNALVIELSEPVVFTENEDHYIQFTNSTGSNSDLIRCDKGDDEFTVVLSKLPSDPLYVGYSRDKTKYTFCSEQVRDSMAILIDSRETSFDESSVETHTLSGVNYSSEYYSNDLEAP